MSAFGPPPEWAELRVERPVDPVPPAPAEQIADELDRPEQRSLRQGVRVGGLAALAMGAVAVVNGVFGQLPPIRTTDAAGVPPGASPSLPPAAVTTTDVPKTISLHESKATPFAPPGHPWRELPRGWQVGQNSR